MIRDTPTAAEVQGRGDFEGLRPAWAVEADPCGCNAPAAAPSVNQQDADVARLRQLPLTAPEQRQAYPIQKSARASSRNTVASPPAR